MKILKLNSVNQSEVINEAIEILNTGGLVVFPSDTVYGLLADASNPIAIDKLLAFKERPPGKAISVFMTDENMVSKYVVKNQNAKNVIKNLLPGPFTVVCKINNYKSYKRYKNYKSYKQENQVDIDPRLLAENGTLGFRIPDYPLILELVKRFGRPVTATSANMSSTPPHYSINSLLKSLKSPKKLKLLSLIIDAGKLPYHKPSTVIDTTTGQLKTLRFGDLLPKTATSIISKSESETRKLAQFIVTKKLKESFGKPLVFLLEGALGTGKTIFTKGLGKALGIKEEIVSPTFTLSYEYIILNTKTIEILENQLPLSTGKPKLSTLNPIENGMYSDIERLDLNTHFVKQMRKKTTDYRLLTTAVEEEIAVDSKLIHYDLYRIETKEDLKEIGFLESIVPGNIYAIEWPEKIDKQTLEKLKQKAEIVYIKIMHLNEKQREIQWNSLS